MSPLLMLTSALFCLGLYGVLTRRDLVAVLASVEVMLGAGTIQLAAFATSLRATATAASAAAGQGYTLAILVLAAAEAAIGLALLVVLVRAGRTRTDQIEEVRG
jgi:NADH:ubiquinone oxidoreductase subunit K